MPDENDKPATKAAITRLGQKIDRIAVEVVKTQDQMRQMEERINARMDSGFSRILSAIDSLAKKSEKQNTVVALHSPILTAAS